MPRRGLNKQIVLQRSIELIEENGFRNFSLRELARTLNVKVASLYNHIEGMNSLLASVSDYAIELLNTEEFSSTEGLEGDDAIRAMAHAYRNFAKCHPELYRVIMNIYKTHDPNIEKFGMKITLPIMKILEYYPLNDEQRAHWQRIVRSILHGFISQESAGYFNHFPIKEEETFELGVECFIDGLNSFIEKNSGDGESAKYVGQ